MAKKKVKVSNEHIYYRFYINLMVYRHDRKSYAMAEDGMSLSKEVYYLVRED